MRPLVIHGVSAISRLQVWTQPLWLVMLVVPYAVVLVKAPDVFSSITHYVGQKGSSSAFDVTLFGAALTVGVALITQMGEQADYLRFMPAKTPANRWRWWGSVLAGGPGWVLLGVVKMLGGELLAYLAIVNMVPLTRAVDPNHVCLAAYEYVFPNYPLAVAATALFVVVSQLKINVTNAYAGSLAWLNFFSRLTHSHPGRVVWVVFNTLIAFMLMEMNVFQALGDVLGLYSNIAIAWIMAVVADLVINKPLGLSPKGIEFKRAYLYDVNPVGVGAMALASGLSVAAHLGLFGPLAQAFSAVIAMLTALVASPLIAWATRGKYYIARQPECSAESRYQPLTRFTTQRCVICERDYEGPDMAHCPAYQGAICSLCCTLDARCGDLCKPQAALSAQWSASLRWLLPRRAWPYLDTGLSHFVLLMGVIVPLLASVFGLLYYQQVDDALILADGTLPALRAGFLKAYAALLLISGLVAWWLVLAHKSRQVAQEESNRQTQLLNEQTRALQREIDSHRVTDDALQQARQVADAARHAADQASQAKSRYISAISHELRTPLNSILGYAQLMGEDASIPPHRKQAVNVIKRGGEHLLSLIEGTLDIARIEAGKLALSSQPMQFADCVQEVAALFELQAAAKGLNFVFETTGHIPSWVRADEKRVRQILINLLGNAIKFTARGRVTFSLRYAREMAHISIEDTGPGMTSTELAQIFEPFARGDAAGPTVGGAGLGLTIAKMLTDLMGGEMTVSSTPGVGSAFRIRLFLPEVHGGVGTAKAPARPARARPHGYLGERRRVLVVDNEEADRDLLVQLLEPLGFELRVASSGHDCLDLLAAGYVPHVILMDLAMPGIDGWETLRRIRASAHTGIQLAVVSANAFDKALDNDVGIPTDDFIVKPVRHTELLDWLEKRLGLTWMEAAGEAVIGPRPVPVEVPMRWVWPDGAALTALLDVVNLGFYRGVLNQLAKIEITQPETAGFVTDLRAMARQFQFEAMGELIAQQLHQADAVDAIDATASHRAQPSRSHPETPL